MPPVQVRLTSLIDDSVEPFVANFLMSADFLAAATNLIYPTFDLVRQPELLSPSQSRYSGTELLVSGPVTTAWHKLEPRLRTLAENNFALVETINMLKTSPAYSYAHVRAMVCSNEATIYKLLTTPLQQKVRTSTSTTQDNKVTIADILYNKARCFALMVWLLSFSTASNDELQDPQTTALSARYLTELATNLQATEAVLQETNWEIDPSLCLWLYTILVAQTSSSPPAGNERQYSSTNDFLGRITNTVTEGPGQAGPLLAAWPPLQRQWTYTTSAESHADAGPA